MHYVIIQVHASMCSVAACHITRHLLHAYNEQLFNLLQSIFQFEVEFVRNVLPQSSLSTNFDEVGQNQF